MVVLPRTYSQTLSHTAAISRASHPATRSNTWWKTKENTGPTKNLFPNTLSHCCHLQSLSSCCQVQYLGENKGKHWLVVVLPRTYSQTLSHTAAISRASHPAARSSTWWKTKENTGLVVVLPRTYAPNTLSHCCHLQSLSSCCQVQYLGENKGKHCVGGGPTKNLFPVSDQHKGGNWKPPYKYNHLKH